MLLLLLGCGAPLEVPPDPGRDPTGAWSRFLQEIVTEAGRVDYRRLRKNPRPLREYLGWVAEHGPESDGWRLMDDNRRLAYHINAYNAWVLYGVLKHWPIASVKDVHAPFGPPGTGFFGWMRVRVDQEWVSLHTWERWHIFPVYQHPLVHVALNCAARSCPPLRNRVYTAAKLDEELDEQMRRWVNGGAVAREGDTLVFSAIFDWYAEDFRAWAGAETPCAAVEPYAEGEVARWLAELPDCPRRFAAYDWGLNAAE